MENFIRIGDLCGGFIEISKMTSGRMNMLEASIKVEGNFFGFIPAYINIPPSSSFQTSATIDPFFNQSIFAKYYAGFHGRRPPYSPENLYRRALSSPRAKGPFGRRFFSPTRRRSPFFLCHTAWIFSPLPVLRSWTVGRCRRMWLHPLSPPFYLQKQPTPHQNHQNPLDKSHSSPCSTPIGSQSNLSDFLPLSSPPNLAALFDLPEPSAYPHFQPPPINPEPLIIDRSHLNSCHNQFFKSLNGEDMELDNTQKQNKSIDLGDTEQIYWFGRWSPPPNFHLILPWLYKHGLCISPYSTKPKKSTATKRVQKNVRELQNLHSSINYDRQSAYVNDGSHIPSWLS